jgi:nucleoside-diphosphate-sugar epimerase
MVVMAHVLVTGGSGKLGRAVVTDLLATGYAVTVADLAPAPIGGDAAYLRLDLTDFGSVVEALTRVDDRYDHVDAVVHLAAIPAPGLTTQSRTFANNVLSTYHVFSAARVAGVRNLVWASSETVLGLPFQTPPPYLPIDEDYRVRPESTYSLGKAVEEEMAYHFCRWDPQAKVVGLRFSNVMDVADYARFPTWQDDPSIRRWNAWGYIDARDGAQAVRKALQHAGTGYEVFVIANADTVMRTPSAELVASQFPGVPVRCELTGRQTLLSIDKARRVLGYDPVHSWTEHVS